eukprot:gene6992-9556_t
MDSISRMVSQLMNNSENNNLIANTKGQQLLKSIRLPHGKDEAWRHLNLKQLFSQPYIPSSVVRNNEPFQIPAIETINYINQYVDEECSNSYLVVIDGIFRPDLSKTKAISASVKLSSIRKSEPSNDATFLSSISSIPDSSELPRNSHGSDFLTALNLANLDDSILVSVMPNSRSSPPLQVILCSTEKDSVWSSPRLIINVESDASTILKQTYISLPNENGDVGKPHLINSNTQIYLGENSALSHTFSQELSDSSRHIEVLSIDQKANSSYSVSLLQLGGNVGRVNIHANLLEPKSNCTINGLILAGEKQSFDLHSSILHNTTSTTSRQQQRNIVGAKGLAIFKGRIRIPSHAQLSASEQLCKSLMMAESARVIAMPTLEISADNIECSHGASVSDLDENFMFYLAARGVNRKEARKLLLRGFVFDLLSDALLDKASVNRIISKLELMNPDGHDKQGNISTSGSLQKLASI